MPTDLPDIPVVALNDGRSMPQLGLGVFRVPAAEAAEIVGAALALGYPAIDTAAIYGNEAGVGQAVRGVERPVFVTSKIWIRHYGAEQTPRAFEEIMARLGLDWLDLLLLHWPTPDLARSTAAWKALVELHDDHRLRSIGVSNYTPEQLRRLIGETGMVPAVNQVELHPRFQQRALREFHDTHAIATTSWAPLGRGTVDDPVVAEVARKHGKTPAQAIIRWHLDSGLVVIPKSARRERLAENIDVLDFALDADDLAAFAGLDRGEDGRTGPDPTTFSG